jgi:hypothetical protein
VAATYVAVATISFGGVAMAVTSVGAPLPTPRLFPEQVVTRLVLLLILARVGSSPNLPWDLVLVFVAFLPIFPKEYSRPF